MKIKYQQLYSEMLVDIARCQQPALPEAENIKPLFTSQIEFYTIVYQAVLFKPEANPDKLQAFWKEESKRLQRFNENKEEFVSYFKSGDTCLDQQYFLLQNNDAANIHLCKVYDQEMEYTTSHDCLVASLLAQEMYHEYVKERLELLVCRRFGAHFAPNCCKVIPLS